MIEVYQKEMKNTIDDLVNNEKLLNAKIVVFGSNEPAECIVSYLSTKGYDVLGFVDNNDKKQGSIINNIKVYSPSKLLSNFDDEMRILIASKYYNEMCNQLKKYGYIENKHIFQVVKMKQKSQYSFTEKTFINKEKMIRKGVELLRDLKRNSKNSHIFICPYSALGDIYLVGGYLKKYCLVNNIDKWIVMVPTKVCAKVLKMYDILNVQVMEKEDLESLLQASIFIGFENSNVEVLHQRFPYTAAVGKIGNYRRIDFNTLFAEGIFGLKVEDFTRPVKGKYKHEVAKTFEQMELQPGKTVVISPYANTISELPMEFWEKKVLEYINMGYTVVTNSSGENEPAITGTKAAFIPIEQMIDFVEYAGTFEALRSGLCDVIESANAVKIIYYPDRIYQCGKMIDFYGLRAMGFHENVKEIVM